MNRLKRSSAGLTATLLFAALFSGACGKDNPTVPPGGGSVAGLSLGSAQSYVVLGASAVTSTGGTAITGDLGVSSPGISPTGFPPGNITGTTHSGDAASAQAQADLTPAYDALAAKTCGTPLTGQDLGSRTLGSKPSEAVA